MRAFLLLLALPIAAAAQTPAEVARDRAAFTRWLATAPLSPFAAVALQPIGSGVTVGPAGSDVVLDGIGGQVRITDDGVARLTTPGSTRPVPRGRAIPLGPYHLLVAGDPRRSTLLAYGPVRAATAPLWFPFDSALVVTGPIAPPPEPTTQRMLSLDGVAQEVSQVGTFSADLLGHPVRLRAYRFPDGAGEESTVYLYFRDATNETTTYSAGRWVEAVPLGGGRYRVDFNRARNSFCAYSTVYPCPLPWQGNTLPFAIEGGERYEAHDPPGVSP